MLRHVALMVLAATYPVGASCQTSNPPKAATNPQDKIVCKRFAVTGSLVDSKKVCKTNREWQKERDDLRLSSDGGDSCRNRANGGDC